ncbi:hypothetical protein ABZ297_29890 [Nonomuraea sp. NPDC005983]|uniref:hypothetical protein n=1 Tax=Nonomuraea sp. NPDC005983 TaxID=3155595 RepID=UPI0033A56D46
MSGVRWQQAVRVALDHATALDTPVAAMAAQAWVGGGAPAFGAELVRRRRGLHAALESALAELAASEAGPPPVPPALGSPSASMTATHGAFSGVDVTQLTSSTS